MLQHAGTFVAVVGELLFDYAHNQLLNRHAGVYMAGSVSSRRNPPKTESPESRRSGAAAPLPRDAPSSVRQTQRVRIAIAKAHLVPEWVGRRHFALLVQNRNLSRGEIPAHGAGFSSRAAARTAAIMRV